MANAASHLQRYKKRKLGCVNKRNPSTSMMTTGDTLIGNLLNRDMILLPFTIGPLGQFGPILEHFLFGSHPTPPYFFPCVETKHNKDVF